MGLGAGFPGEHITEGLVLHAVFDALFEQKVSLEGMVLKPNMVFSGTECVTRATVDEVARATVRCLRRHAPAAVPGIVFLSGGQDHLVGFSSSGEVRQRGCPRQVHDLPESVVA